MEDKLVKKQIEEEDDKWKKRRGGLCGGGGRVGEELLQWLRLRVLYLLDCLAWVVV